MQIKILQNNMNKVQKIVINNKSILLICIKYVSNV